MRKGPQRTRRRVGQRERSTVIRVLTEGEVTEREYLSLICRDSAKLQFGKSSSAPIQMINQAKREVVRCFRPRVGEFKVYSATTLKYRPM